MGAPATTVWLIAGYSLALLVVGWGFDVMARRASAHAARWRTGRFTYRPDHDAWICPQDHWLWPTSFDPKHRVMRYRALPVVCNSCPVKSECTTSEHGRVISREVDPWPHSDAGRFHRGIACCVAGLGIVLPLATWVTNHTAAYALVLTATVLLVALIGAGIVVLVVLGFWSLVVLREYERGVVFRMGHVRPLYGPGLRFLIPLLDKMIRVDQRLVTLTIPPQEVITRDNVPARVNAVVMFQMTDPRKAIPAVENYAVATSQIAQTTQRSLLGQADLDTLLAHREDLNNDLRTIIDKQTEPWGVQVHVVEIKDVEIPESMQRAMAREAEAERERRAKVINAHGELQASEELREAAETLSKSPASLQLRYLQTLLELGADQNSKVVFPLPVDIITPFLRNPELLQGVVDNVGRPG